MTERELKERLAARGIDWEIPSIQLSVHDFVMGYMEALLALLEQVDRDYPKK